MQRDVMAHRPSEVDGLVYEVVRMAHRYQVPVPAYEKVAQKLQGEIMCEKNSHTEGNVEIIIKTQENNMEYKYSTINEVNHFEFGEAVVGDIQLTERMFHLVLDNVKICPENSCNRDIRMMRTNELLFKISDAEIISLVEEGYNEYDADGNLKHTYPDEEVEKAKYDEVAQVLLEGTIYELTLQSGVYTFIIDGTNDRTYALKVTGSGDTQEWNRFLEV